MSKSQQTAKSPDVTALTKAASAGAEEAEIEAYGNIRDQLGTAEERRLLSELSRVAGSNMVSKMALKIDVAMKRLDTGKPGTSYALDSALFWAEQVEHAGKLAEDLVFYEDEGGHLEAMYRSANDLACDTLWNADAVVNAKLADLQLPASLEPMPMPLNGSNWMAGAADWVGGLRDNLDEPLAHAALTREWAEATGGRDPAEGGLTTFGLIFNPVLAAPSEYESWLWYVARNAMGRLTYPDWMMEASDHEADAIDYERAQDKPIDPFD